MMERAQVLRLNGDDFDLSQASDKAKQWVAELQSLEILAKEKTNMLAILTKAKNAYISDLKMEIVKNKSGVDLASLFDTE
ncbi:hypothetical protein N8306_01960 [Yoonia sp.]|nr:hypothetical protein [Yoonia sp.]